LKGGNSGKYFLTQINMNMLKKILWSIGFLLPMLLQAQNNVYPAHAFQFVSSPEEQTCSCVPAGTTPPPKCPAWDYKLTDGYSYIFAILNLNTVSCYNIGGVRAPDSDLVRFVRPYTGWPDTKLIYYYFPKELNVSLYTEKSGVETLFEEKKLTNVSNQRQELFNKKPVIGGEFSTFVIKLTSEANIKTLRMRVWPYPKSGSTISGDQKTLGSYSDVKLSEHEVIIRYTIPTAVHDNLGGMGIDIYDYNVPVTPNTPVGYVLYSPRFQFATPPVTIALSQEQNGINVEFEKKDLKDPSQYSEAFKTKIAGDGSTDTIIKLSSDQKLGALALRVVDLAKTPQTNAEEVGVLTLKEEKEKELTYSYMHPTHSGNTIPNLGIEVYNKGNNGTMYKPQIKLVPAAVVMLHGLWSNGAIWKSLMSYLIAKSYENARMWNPSYASGESFAANAGVLARNIEIAQNRNSYNGVLGRRVDIVAHSMGGILTRNYIQSASYKKDINKLITLDTPHSGSQIANIVYEDTKLSGAMSFVKNTSSSSALENLRVNSEAMKSLNGSALNNNMNTVSVHAIVGQEPLDPTVVDDGKNKVWGLGGYLLPMTAMFKLCSDPNTPNIDYNQCLETKVFKAKNDWIVGIDSQQGGLGGANVTGFGSNHLTIHQNASAQEKVYNLLSEKNTSLSFSRSGFNPVVLDWKPTHLNKTSTSPSAGSIGITSPKRGALIRANSTLKVEVKGTTEIRNIVLGYGSDSLDVGAQVLKNVGQGVFSIDISSKINQKLRLAAIGFDANGGVSIDTMTVNISTTVANEPDDIAPSASLQLTASPNPVSDAVSLQWNMFLEGDVEIYDVLGKVVLRKHVTGNEAEFDTRTLRNGAYFVHLTSRDKVATTRFVKMK
jgi:triacylglycerol esterase/lipase EstA (alpha/beta hydrolase family)